MSLRYWEINPTDKFLEQIHNMLLLSQEEEAEIMNKVWERQQYLDPTKPESIDSFRDRLCVSRPAVTLTFHNIGPSNASYIIDCVMAPNEIRPDENIPLGELRLLSIKRLENSDPIQP